jgi:formylglycine-generating enzyme required for sulfatase activity
MAREDDPAELKRKVVKGGSWKDIAYYLQCGVRTYEYQGECRSYIGFRCVRSYAGVAPRQKGDR